MADVFWSGPVGQSSLLAVVLARAVAVEAAVFGKDDGLLLRGLTADELARLEFYAGVSGAQVRPVSVVSGGADVPALGVFPEVTAAQTEVLATAADVMALYGAKSVAQVRRRYELMLVRGAARLRAEAPQPARLRLEGRVQVAARREPYAHFFAVEEYDLSFQRFDGSASPVVTRAVFVSGDAVTVLPYDPVRDRVLVVEQFRSGPFARGDSQPWQIEAIAGRIDVGETAEEAARREAVEEAGLTLGALLPIAGYYPTPGISAEFLYSYLAITDLPDGAAGVFGVEGEAEDIRGHLISFDDLMALVATGEISNAPLIMTAYWLQAHRAELRKA